MGTKTYINGKDSSCNCKNSSAKKAKNISDLFLVNLHMKDIIFELINYLIKRMLHSGLETINIYIHLQ